MNKHKYVMVPDRIFQTNEKLFLTLNNKNI